MTTRQLDEGLLNACAVNYAREAVKPNRMHPYKPGRALGGKKYVIDAMYSFDFKDEFEFVAQRMKERMDGVDYANFVKSAAGVFTPRSDDVLEELLLRKRAENPAGEHVPGAIGTVQIGQRVVGRVAHEVPRWHSEQRSLKQRLTFTNGTLTDRVLFRSRTSPELIGVRTVMRNEYWPVYMGELEEREAGNVRSKVGKGSGADPIPEGAVPFSPYPTELFATNPKMSAATAITVCDAIVDAIDGGTGAGIVRGYTGTQPADVDTAASGTLLFTVVCNDPAFGNASDTTDDATATANDFTIDSEADAGGTVGYCRVWSTNDGATPLLGILDGEAGTSASDFNFNDVVIVSGSPVDITAMTVVVNE